MAISEPAADPTPPAYLVAAHPDWRLSRVNGLLLQTLRGVPGVHVNDLYASYPDYDIDVPTEQRRLVAASLVVLQFPIHWYSVPPLLKLWLDEVLALGWAYGRQGTALRGKDLWIVASTGGPQDSYRDTGYNGHPVEDYLLPLAQTARLCGMRFLPPLVLHGANGVLESRIQTHAEQVAERLRSWPAWVDLSLSPAAPLFEIPPSDRPAAPVQS